MYVRSSATVDGEPELVAAGLRDPDVDSDALTETVPRRVADASADALLVAVPPLVADAASERDSVGGADGSVAECDADSSIDGDADSEPAADGDGGAEPGADRDAARDARVAVAEAVRGLVGVTDSGATCATTWQRKRRRSVCCAIVITPGSDTNSASDSANDDGGAELRAYVRQRV